MTIAILSWNAPQTLRNTLESYRRFGLDKLDDDRLIWFQEATSDDLKIAEEFGYAALASNTNVGIAAAYSYLVEEARGEFFLFLENDWELIDEPRPRLRGAVHLLQSGLVDVVRLRSRFNPGAPLWSMQFSGSEHEHPTHLLDAVHWRDDPREVGLVQKNILDGDNEQRFWIASAKNANWTNNPHLAYTSFLKKNILPQLSGGDLEHDIQGWWQNQDFMVGQGQGLFTHMRLDR